MPQFQTAIDRVLYLAAVAIGRPTNCVAHASPNHAYERLQSGDVAAAVAVGEVAAAAEQD